MQKLKKFFWRCSGVNIDLLEKCPTEESKYVGIGGTIFFTGLFAALSGGYALYTVFDNVFMASLFAIVWGLSIFNLDRFIVSSMRKGKSRGREFLMALPRIILAIFISIVIAKPLELKIFEKEINGELVVMGQEKLNNQEVNIRLRYKPVTQQREAEITQLKEEIAVKSAQRDELLKIAREEADGTGGTKQRNAGPIYAIKKANADQAEKELQKLSERNLSLINEKLTDINRSDSSILAEVNALNKASIDGPAARMEALDRVAQKSSVIWLASLFVILLFIAIETAPIFVKLISPIGPYDHLLKEVEHGFFVGKVEALAKQNADTKEQAKDLRDTEKDYITNRLDIDLQQS